MKVVHFIERFHPHLGGGEIHVRDLVHHKFDGIEHVVLTDAVKGFPVREKISPQCEVLRFSPLDVSIPSPWKNLNTAAYPLRILSCYARFQRKIGWLQENTYDLLHVHGPGIAINFNPLDRILGFPLLTRMASFRRIKTPKILSFHSYMSNFTNHRVDRQQELREIREFENIICVDAHISDQVKEQCSRRGFKRDIRLIPHTINNAVFPFRSHNKNEEKLKLLFIGRLSREKGIDALLRLLKKKLSFLEVQLVVADGEYTVEAFRRSINDEAIKIFPEVPNHSVAQYIYNCDLLFNPVQAKGISRVSLEAMSCGRPVIMFQQGDRYPIKHEETGFLINPDDDAGLFSLLEYLQRDRDIISRIGEKASEVVQEEFSNSSGFQRIFDFYQEILGK